MKRILFLLCLGISFSGVAQDDFSEANAEQLIDTFFEGLHQGDSSIVSSTLHSGIKIQTTYTNKEGKRILRDETREKLLAGIAGKKKTDTYLEKLLSYDIKVDGTSCSLEGSNVVDSITTVRLGCSVTVGELYDVDVFSSNGIFSRSVQVYNSS